MALTQVDQGLLNSYAQYTGFKNRLINGGMQIDQRNAGASVSDANGFITDRWSLGKYGPTGGAYSGQQVTDAPSGFTNSLKVTVTTSVAQSSDQYWQAFQTIEGYNVADLGFGTSSPSQVTVSFWVKASVTGTYSIALFNNGFGSTNRAYVTTYTISAANTWEQKSVTITGDGTSGAGYWGTTNGNGIGVYFDLGCGSNQETTANTWVTGNYRRVAGTVRLMGTGSATWQVTGVQLEKGSTATSFDYRPYGTELALCQRYYVRAHNSSTPYVQFAVGRAYSTTNGTANVILPVSMRATPTFGYTTPVSGNFDYSATALGSSGFAGNINNNYSVNITGGFTSGQAFVFAAANVSTYVYIDFSAEL